LPSKQTSSSAPAIKLRAFTKEDYPFVRDLYASTRSEEMAVVPWTDEQRRMFVEAQFRAQLDHYQQHYPEATHDLILKNDRPVGRLYVSRSDDEVEIMDIIVAPQERNAGIGYFLLQQILAEGERDHKTVGIYVESFNPSLQFFKRLGFAEVEIDGFQVHLRWTPPNAKSTDTEEGSSESVHD
jgi:GNAT superfamily N-acetyltransferase